MYLIFHNPPINSLLLLILVKKEATDTSSLNKVKPTYAAISVHKNPSQLTAFVAHHVPNTKLKSQPEK